MTKCILKKMNVNWFNVGMRRWDTVHTRSPPPPHPPSVKQSNGFVNHIIQSFTYKMGEGGRVGEGGGVWGLRTVVHFTHGFTYDINYL